MSDFPNFTISELETVYNATWAQDRVLRQVRENASHHLHESVDRELALLKQGRLKIDALMRKLVGEPVDEGPEPSPIRDLGPYDSEERALRQVERTTFGIPTGGFRVFDIVLGEALFMTNADPSEFETDRLIGELEGEDGKVDTATIQILASWLLRAYLSGTRQPGLILNVASEKDKDAE